MVRCKLKTDWASSLGAMYINIRPRLDGHSCSLAYKGIR